MGFLSAGMGICLLLHIPPQTECDEESENWEFALLLQEQDSKIQQRALLNLALSQLSEKERFVIKRLYWDGWTESEIAQALSMSQQAINKIKKRALQKLRDMLS